MFHPGSIVLTAIPQADGDIKNRPALLLTQMPGQKDWLVCGISRSQFLAVPGFDEVLLDSDPEFKASGLKVSGVIRAGFVSVLPEQRFEGVLGGIKEVRAKGILSRLAKYLTDQSR